MKRSVYATAAACLILLGWTGCSRKPAPAFEGSGVLEATEVTVGAKTAGTVDSLAVKEGDSVGRGDVLCVIETEKLLLQKRQLAAGLNEVRLNIQNARRAADLAEESFRAAEKEFERIRALHGESSVSQQQFEDAETGFLAAKTQWENSRTSLQALASKEEQVRLQLELAESGLDDATLRSPLSGVVTQLYVDRGEIARPGGPVASVADLERMWIKVYVKETDLGRVKLNSEAVIRVDSAPGREFKGRVSWISQKAEFTPKMVQTKDARSDLVYAVKVEVANPDGTLKIGMPADVTIP
ncbi:MAG: efflux RND transporter periplasmic adaptor subunit [bacterium]|nr:efflux RND transporter periplasmic adaptor subunit [bacterium]